MACTHSSKIPWRIRYQGNLAGHKKSLLMKQLSMSISKMMLSGKKWFLLNMECDHTGPPLYPSIDASWGSKLMRLTSILSLSHGCWFLELIFCYFGLSWVMPVSLRDAYISWSSWKVDKSIRQVWRMISTCFGARGRRETKGALMENQLQSHSLRPSVFYLYVAGIAYSPLTLMSNFGLCKLFSHCLGHL